MKKLSVVLLLTTALIAFGLPLNAQNPDLSRIYAHPPIAVSSGPLPLNTPSGYTPAQFRAAYGFNRVPNYGQGTTIALVDAFDDPNIESDLAFYANYFHLTPCNFQKVKLGTIQGQGWDLEEALDVEQACAIAPQANIVLVEAATNSFDDLFAAVQVATQPPYNATAVSMSWGGGEFNGEQQSDSLFCNIVNGNGQPVTFFASTGDGGHGTIYPSTSPCVIGVGGTTLGLSRATQPPSTGTIIYGSENAWRDGGGGLSQFESQPSYQNPACSTWSTSARCVPDISSVATNIPVYDTFSFGDG
jgi:subtilase family serine protease